MSVLEMLYDDPEVILAANHLGNQMNNDTIAEQISSTVEAILKPPVPMFHENHVPPLFVRLLPKRPSPHGKLVFASTEFVPFTRPDGIVVRMVRTRSFNENRNKIKSMLGHGKMRRQLRKFFQRKARADELAAQAA